MTKLSVEPDLVQIAQPADPAIAIRIARSSPQSFPSTGEPLTFGIPLPKGMMSDAAAAGFTLHDDDGRAFPTETRVLDRWSDGSVRWMLVDTQVDARGSGVDQFLLKTGAAQSARPALSVRQAGTGVAIDTGPATFELRPGGSALFHQVIRDGRSALDSRRSDLSAFDTAKQACTVSFRTATIDQTGAMRVVAAMTGEILDPRGAMLLELFVKLHFYAGLSTVRLLITVRNPKMADHPGGYWDLGSSGSVYFEELSLSFALAAESRPADVWSAVEPQARLHRVGNPTVVYQDSSGGENWQSRNHQNKDRIVPQHFRGYRVESDADVQEGHRATPILAVRQEHTSVSVAMPHFWQNFPKSLEARDDRIVVGLFPGRYADVYELQGGEQKTHEVFVTFGQDTVTDEPLAWSRSRLVAAAAPEWYCQSGAVPYLTPADTQADADRVAIVTAAIEGADTFEQKREIVDEYGWRHFGDIYGDHEAVRHQGGTTLVSHYNNQYDAIQGFARQFMRSGDLRWWTQMQELAAHVIDIDIYHTVEDKWAYNHGLFWHTYHYGDADTATHRSYPRAASRVIGGGGPSPDQNYTTGLMLHYFLTGDGASRQTVEDSAQYVIDADDGRKTIFRWLDSGPTGYASASGSYSYHGPGRSPANSLNALVDGYRLTGRRALLEKAEELIRRCVHPEEQIAALNLDDAEQRWFYTMFLQSLGKYLDDKAERDELDAMYAYGRATLLHYARWMADHEAPYLDRPERLEFPTETWAAQDIRKSDIFYFAARHAGDDERDRFLERGGHFFSYATRTLRGMRTRTLARPVVILLSNGPLHAWFRTRQPAAAPAPRAELQPGRRRGFVPQKVRAKKRAVMACVVTASAAATGAIVWLLQRVV